MNSGWWRTALLFFACWANIALSHGAARPDSLARNYSVRRWTTEDGLPQNRVNCLAQTPDGYLWCGTHIGLARFDGRRFVTFDRQNTPAMEPSETVYAMTVDRNGKLWVGTSKGCLRFREDKLEAVDLGPDHVAASIETLVARKEGGVLAGSTTGLFQGLDSPLARLPRIPVPDEATRSIRLAETASGELFWTGQRHGDLIVQQLGTTGESGWTNMSFGDGGASRHLGGCLGLTSEGLWLVAQPGLVRISSDGRKDSIPLPVELDRVGIWGGCVSPEGGLWLVDRDWRLWRFESTGCHPVPLPDDVRFRETISMFVDRESNLWIASVDGLFRLSRRLIETYTTRDGLPNEEVWTVSPSANGGAWVGTRMGFAKISQGTVEAYPIDIPKSLYGAQCVIETREGRVLAASITRGLFELIGKTWELLPGCEDPIDALYQDRLGRIWAGSEKGLWTMEPTTKTLNRVPEPALPRIRVIHQHRDLSYWFGMRYGGLARFDAKRGRTSRLGPGEGLSSDEVWAIEETEDGALWLGTSKGLGRVDPAWIRSQINPSAEMDPVGNRPPVLMFTEAHGMPMDVVNWIVPDDVGHFWLSGLRGIHRVSRAGLEAVARSEVSSASCATYGVLDGMESAETNGEHQPSGCRSTDGRIWFPTTFGVAVVDPRVAARSSQGPEVILEEVTADDEVLWSNSSISDKPHSDRSKSPKADGPHPWVLGPGRGQWMRFTFTAPTYHHVGKVRFRHRLRGLGDAWREVGSERQAYYPGLAPGEYTFEVKAASADGIWSSSPTRYRFSIQPRFSQTAWFPASLTLLGVTFVGGIGAWRLRWQRQLLEARRQRDLERERSRIARDMHDDLGARLARVSMLSDLAVTPGGVPPQTLERVSQIAATARETMVAMEELVWAVNPGEDTLPSLLQFVGRWVEEFSAAANLRCRVELPSGIRAILVDSQHRQACLFAIKEALRNVVKHSGASEVRLRARVEERMLELELEDNGRGLAAARQVAGRNGLGLDSITQRLRDAGGEARIENADGGGVRVLLRLPLRS